MKLNRFFIVASSILLGLGLFAPTLTIYPKAGELTWFLEIFAPDELSVSSYSILGVIEKLISGNDFFLAVLLGLFSVISPIIKLSLYWRATNLYDSPKFKSVLQKIHYVGKFSMAEVFALALIIVVIKSFPGGSSAELEWGAYVFSFSVICSMIVSFKLDSKKK